MSVLSIINSITRPKSVRQRIQNLPADEKKMKEKDGEWGLPSGVWVQTNESFSLTKTARGRPVSAHASPADIATVVGSTFEDRSPRGFSPEFLYSPLTGLPLGKPPSSEAAGWAPPFGNASIDAGGSCEARGLRRTQHSLRNIPFKHC